jgi:RimJ/RimL family protein N-acetyltransferase
MNKSLFEGRLVNLAAYDPDRDAAVEASWTERLCYWRAIDESPARPLSADRVKKRHEKTKDAEQKASHFPFALREREGDRLVGLVELRWISWPNRTAWLRLAIGDPADHGKGYGRDALQLILRYAFAELNLNRVAVKVPEYNEAALRFYQQAGFSIEVRQREARQVGGRFFDLLWLGMLQPEWLASRSENE